MANFVRRFEVVKTDTKIDGVEVGGKYMGFGRSGGFAIDDADKARDIDAEWGIASRKRGRKDKVMVMPVDDKRIEEGHNYTFSTVAMPWVQYDELGRRLPEGADNGKESHKGTKGGSQEGQEAGREEGVQARGQDAHEGQDAYEGEGTA